MSGDEKYTIAICKGAALLEETRTLLNHWNPDERIDDFAKRVQEEGILGNATAYRTRDIVRRVFMPRYLRPTDQPAKILKAVLNSDMPPSVFRELVLLYAARNDRLINDYVIREFWPAFRRGRRYLDVPTVLAFFSEATADGYIERLWSEQVSKKVARGLLGFLRDIGFLREPRRGVREVMDYRLSDEGLVLIARELHEQGFHDASLCGHPNWQLFGMNENDVISRMHLLSEDHGFLLQRAGSVVAINWQVSSINELPALLARNRSMSRLGTHGGY